MAAGAVRKQTAFIKHVLAKKVPMRRILTFAVIVLAGLSVTRMGIAGSAAPPVSAIHTEKTTVIQLDRAVSFSTADGSEVSIPAGTYRVEGAAGTNLRLVADAPQAAREISAISIAHEETLTAPLAFAVREEEQADAVHLLLLLPGGKGLDAAGRTGDVQTRGGHFLVRPRTKYTGAVMQQGRVKMDKDIENDNKRLSQLNTKVQLSLSEANDAQARLGRCDYCKLLQEMRK